MKRLIIIYTVILAYAILIILALKTSKETKVMSETINEADIVISQYKAILNDTEIIHSDEINQLNAQITNLNKEISNLRTSVDTSAQSMATMKDLFSKLSTGAYITDTFTLTAYSPYDNVNGIQAWGDGTVTRSGTTPKPGTIAVDPDVIPLGSLILIEYEDGTFEAGIAEDTGGCINGNHIDVFRYTYEEARQVAKQTVTVTYFFINE